MSNKRTHCREGHAYTPENTWIGARGRQICRTCSRKAYREAQRQRNEAAGGQCAQCGAPTTLQRDRKTPHRLCRPCSDKLNPVKLGAHAQKGPENAHWVGDAARPQTGRKRAAQLYQAVECQRCEATEHVERHHIDGDTANNAPENIAILCRRCHMEADGRSKHWFGQAA